MYRDYLSVGLYEIHINVIFSSVSPLPMYLCQLCMIFSFGFAWHFYVLSFNFYREETAVTHELTFPASKLSWRSVPLECLEERHSA